MQQLKQVVIDQETYERLVHEAVAQGRSIDRQATVALRRAMGLPCLCCQHEIKEADRGHPG